MCAVLAVVALTGWTGAAAWADPAPKPYVPAPKPGTVVCKITDNHLVGLSGMVATGDGYAVVNDGTVNAGALEVFFLDSGCHNIRRYVDYQQPNAPEDLAVAKDGTLWVADIGDPDRKREHVALWRVPPGHAANRGQASLYRMTYPDGKHDAEAMFMPASGHPIIVTKENPAGIYTTTAPLNANSPVPLQKVGTFKPVQTGTPGGPIPVLSQLLVTGAATSPDGTRIALRTYTDAYEWDLTDGDIVKTITTRTPRITPLPNEPQGESLTYSADGKSFVTVSETSSLPNDVVPTIMRYTPSVPPPPTKAAKPGAPAAAASSLSLSDITLMVAMVGVVGLGLVIAGVVGIRRARRSGPDGDDPPIRARGAAPVSPVGGAAAVGRGSTYGRASAEPAVYGRGPDEDDDDLGYGRGPNDDSGYGRGPKDDLAFGRGSNGDSLYGRRSNEDFGYGGHSQDGDSVYGRRADGDGPGYGRRPQDEPYRRRRDDGAVYGRPPADGAGYGGRSVDGDSRTSMVPRIDPPAVGGPSADPPPPRRSRAGSAPVLPREDTPARSADPGRAGRARVDPGRAGRAQVDPGRAGRAQVDPGRAGQSRGRRRSASPDDEDFGFADLRGSDDEDDLGFGPPRRRR